MSRVMIHEVSGFMFENNCFCIIEDIKAPLKHVGNVWPIIRLTITNLLFQFTSNRHFYNVTN